MLNAYNYMLNEYKAAFFKNIPGLFALCPIF